MLANNPYFKEKKEIQAGGETRLMVVTCKLLVLGGEQTMEQRAPETNRNIEI